MQKTLKNKEIQSLWNGLQAISNQGDHSRRFAYAVARNIGKLRPIIETLGDHTKPVEEFEKKRVELAMQMAKKNDAGDPIELPNGQGVVIPNMKEFNEKLEAIREETGQKKRDAEVKELMEADEEVDVYMIDFELLPEKINSHVLSVLMPIVKEPSDDAAAAETIH